MRTLSNKTKSLIIAVTAILMAVLYTVPAFAVTVDPSGSIYIPEGTVNVNSGSVYVDPAEYSKVKRVYVPDSARTISAGAFTQYPNLEVVYVDNYQGGVQVSPGATGGNARIVYSEQPPATTATTAAPTTATTTSTTSTTTTSSTTETTTETTTSEITKKEETTKVTESTTTTTAYDVVREDNIEEKTDEIDPEFNAGLVRRVKSQVVNLSSAGNPQSNALMIVITAISAFSLIILGIAKFRQKK